METTVIRDEELAGEAVRAVHSMYSKAGKLSFGVTIFWGPIGMSLLKAEAKANGWEDKVLGESFDFMGAHHELIKE